MAIQVLNSGAVQIIASASSQYEISPQYNKRYAAFATVRPEEALTACGSLADRIGCQHLMGNKMMVLAVAVSCAP